MAYRTEAYDFSFFEERSNAAPVLEPQVEEQPRQNVVELPEQPEPQREARRKPRHNPVKLVAGSLLFSAFFATAITAVYSEVQLIELGEKVKDVQAQLTEAQSLEIQLNMQAAQRMTDAQVEDYAIQQLGMGKLAGSQVVYMHVAQQDKGTVVQQIEGGSWLDDMMAQVKSWLAR